MPPNRLRLIPRVLAATLAVCFAGAANASFHLWQINEIFSNASGTVQYIELTTTASGEQFLAGHGITVSAGGNIHSFVFPSDLPGDSASHRFLIGTQGFADLGIVTLDYVVPNGFLFLPGGSINYADVDRVSYATLPSDGIHAIDRAGSPVVNAPMNFAGAAGSVRTSLDCLLNWAESNFPALFSPHAVSQSSGPYYFRFYAAANIYAGVSLADSPAIAADHAGYLDAAGLHDVGLTTGWLATSGCQ